MKLRAPRSAVAALALAALLTAAAAALAGLSCAGGAVAGAAAGAATGAADALGERAGRVLGEFEDAALYATSLASTPEMRSWSEKEVRDGLSGATIQAKTFGGKVGDRVVLADGKAAAYADGYGQFWLSLAPGVHTLVGRCRGYRDSKVVVDVAPGSVQYVNFYLERR
jgi:hypothetical protein